MVVLRKLLIGLMVVGLLTGCAGAPYWGEGDVEVVHYDIGTVDGYSRYYYHDTPYYHYPPSYHRYDYYGPNYYFRYHHGRW